MAGATMRRRGLRGFAAITIATTAMFGLVGIGAAGATTSLDVTPATALTDGQQVVITLTGVVPGPLSTLQLAECGNAYGNGTPLLSVPRNAANCEQGIAFVSAGDLTTNPLVFPSVPIRQSGIGTGNRACVAMPPATQPCYVYVSTSVNQPVFPSVEVSFAQDLPTPEPTATTTTITPIGSPIGADKVGHADVQVVANESASMRPEGDVEVSESGNLLGTATLVDGSANVSLGMFSLGAHDLTAHFVGNGSFAPSDASPATMNVISPDNISIGDGSVVEGDSGFRIVTFPVILPKPPLTTQTVTWSVVPSGAHPAEIGSDILSTPLSNLSGKLTFTALKASVRYVKVKVAGDTNAEFDETFSVVLATTGGYVFRRGVGTGTIIDDDTTPTPGVTVGIGAVSVPEGDVGVNRNLSFTLSLSQPVTTGITTVTVQISSITATHGPKATGDWTGAVNRTIKFNPGVIMKPLNLAVFPELRDEFDETVSVAITSASAVGTTVTVGPFAHAIGTILTDE
jgi:hypothetical protein